jgi:glycosyltransferase involved in cell wall biosynthesis
MIYQELCIIYHKPRVVKMEMLSIIAPVYNEEENISKFIEAANNAAKKRFKSYEIILINDGSTDKSKEVLIDEAGKNPNIKVINFTKNNGQTAALAAGFKACIGDFVLTMDSDLQTDPNDMYILFHYINEYDVINGRRSSREDGIKKKISSLVANKVRNFITDENIEDTGCPLKLFKKEVVKSFYLYEGMHRFLPTLAKINGYKVIEVCVSHYDRKFGKSKYGVFNRLFKALKDAFVVRWMKQRKLKYLIEPEVSTDD